MKHVRMMGVFDKYHSWSINNPSRAEAEFFCTAFYVLNGIRSEPDCFDLIQTI